MTEPPAVRIRIADLLVARVAARAARRVPGVVALHGDLGQALLGIAGSVAHGVLGRAPRQPPPAGVTAVVRDGSVEITLTMVTRIGHNCRDLATAVQRAVATEVTGYTGLATTVAVTIAEIVLG